MCVSDDFYIAFNLLWLSVIVPREKGELSRAQGMSHMISLFF